MLKFTAPPPSIRLAVPTTPLPKSDAPPEAKPTTAPPPKTDTPPGFRGSAISPRGRAALAPPNTAAPPARTSAVPPDTSPLPVRASAAPPNTAAPEIKPTEKVQAIYKQLSHAAIDLNSASDELAKPIKVWEGALKRLNLGVPAWVVLSSGGEAVDWWDRGVGYTKLKDGWGIALRTRSGDYQHPDDDSEEQWSFNEAPRWLRIEGVGKLPDLLGALLKQAEDTTKKLKAKIAQANELGEAINTIADELAALERK